MLSYTRDTADHESLVCDFFWGGGGGCTYGLTTFHLRSGHYVDVTSCCLCF